MERIENKFVSLVKDIKTNSLLSDNLKSSNLTEQTNVKPLGTISTNISVTRTISKLKPKVFPRKKAKKSNKIVIIDLTTDIAFERCIKKRKSRKVAWLEEAKKKLDARTIRASQKIKNQQMAENVNSLKKITLNQQLEDSLQPLHATENTTLKNDLNAFTIQDIKLDNEKTKSMQHLDTKHKNISVNGNIVSTKQSVDMNSNGRNETVGMLHCTVSSSVIVDRPQSNKSKTKNSLLDISNDANKISKCHNVNTLEAKNNGKINDRHNTQTVIKRLIEKDTPSESETCKRVESLRNICDLGTEHSKTVNTPLICAQDDSKDGDDNSNYNINYLSTTKDKLSPQLISSLEHCRNDTKNETNDEKIKDFDNNEKLIQEDTCEVISNETQCLKSTTTDSELSKAKFAVSMTAAETRTTTTVSNVEILINDATESERLQQSCITETTRHSRKPKSQDKYVSISHDVAPNNAVSISIMHEDHSNVQTDLKVGTCVEISDDIRDSRFSNRKIRETIFENHTADKKNISNILDMTLCSKEGISSEEDIDLKADHKKTAEFESNSNCGRERNIEKLGRSSVLCKKIDQMHNHKSPKESYKISHTKNIQDSSEDKCIIQDSELHDNIDGLSLLANVIASQHVSHLKTERELKYEQIKVKDYASLRSSPYNQTTDDEADTNDSSNTVSQILENPTTEVINRIVGIYPEDALDKVALHVEVTSTTDSDDRENDPSNSVSHIVETINYETDTISNNLSMVENNVQSVKENTNVILNGETVVLLQKSPNSNLYIINKAVENARDHNSDDESCPIKEKSWMIPPEDCASFEVVNTSENISFNLDLPQYNKELLCQENKYSVGRNKGIKIEPEEESSLMSITEMKSYGKKGSLSADVLSATSQIYQDTNVSISKSVDKRKSKSILTYRQNIKQEFSNHITPNCGIQGCNGIHSHPHEVIDPQHSLHIPVTHPTTIPPIYGNCATGTDLCMSYHKHCTTVSCNLQINSTTSHHSHTKSANSCGRSSHCSQCINCRCDIVAHCRQCMLPGTDSRVSCIESKSYFMPTHSSVQTSAVQEHDRTKSEAVISKLYDDQILHKRVLQNNTLEKLDLPREPEKLFKKDMENKLPLKKRLKTHAMMSMVYEKVPIKTEKLDNYPGIPMMSIAALEMLDGAQKHPTQIIKSSYDLSPTEEDNPHGSYHFNSNIVDYLHISNIHHNLTKESTRNHERQFRPNGDQPNAVCLENFPDRTPAQHRDVTNPTSLKRIATEAIEQDSACKKAKKTQSSIRQTRSSKRKVPKVNYCYTDVDPEWNPSGESKRRRKKTSR